MMTARDVHEETIKSLKADTTLHDEEMASLRAVSDDLSRQVQNLLRQLAIRDDPSLLNVSIDIAKVQDTGDVITDHLLEFKSLRGLQEQNHRLLKLTRGLMSKLEQREIRRATAEEEDVDTVESLDQAAETIEKLHAQLLEANKKINEATRERDMFGKLLARGEGLKWSSGAALLGGIGQGQGHGQDKDRDLNGGDALAPYQDTIDALREEIEGLRSKADEEVRVVREELRTKVQSVGEAEVARARAEATASMLQGELASSLFLGLCLSGP